MFGLALILLAACGPSLSPADQQATAQALAGTIIAQTQTAAPSNTATITASPTQIPTNTATPTASPTPTTTATATLGYVPGAMNVYLIAADANGPIGCGEQLVPLNIGILPSGDPVTDVRTVLQSLFGIRRQYLIGLYNPLYLSSLNIDRVELNSDAGEINVQLSGSLVRGEDHCTWDQIRRMGLATTSAVGGEFDVVMRYNQHLFEDYVSGDHD